jgi:two-component system sensor histidine kinase HydH
MIRRNARSRVNRFLSFVAHGFVWFTVVVFLLVVAGPLPAFIVALSWGIGLGMHGFWAVLAPILRDRWVEVEVGRRVKTSVTNERRVLEGKHSRTLEALSAAVAHEIRNPITAAKSLVQQIGEDPSAADNAEYAKVAVEELDRVERSISHLLKYAREEELTPRRCRMEEIVGSALETLRERTTRSLVTIERDVDPLIVLDADPEKLRRVVLNLVQNAMDSLEESDFPNPTVSVSAGTSLAGDEVWLKVRDNGPGIDPDRMSKIWNPFHTFKQSGTGLGLAITKKIVDAHGGSIAVESELGAGAQFVVTLPAHGAHSGS